MDLSGYVFEALRKDEEFILYRGQNKDSGSQASFVRLLVLSPLAEYPAPEILKWLEHAYSLREELDPAWATRPIAMARYCDRTALVLEDPGGVPLDQLLGQPLDVVFSLRLAISLARAVDHLHQHDLIHKDIKPANVLVSPVNGRCWLTGFGIASRLPRERQAPEPPEFIAGTLPYMAPEQTGRMNRSIDSRSDLYSLGVTLYEVLTGNLPFTASDPMEWVHCHIARQPVSPSERVKTVPATVSAIVMKLLAKTAEERYQTAAGAESDLGRCLAEWESQRCVDRFPLGEHDTPDRLLIPEKLYGREREIKTLLDAFDQVVATSKPNLVLVSGYSGIGKSSVVNELHKVLVPPRGLFASGKFDQYKRDVPYATLAQAFSGLIRPLLSKRESELQIWREAFCEALEPNAKLMADLVPELKFIIGEQPSVPDLPPQDAQRRFQWVFRRFIGVFARPEHPLALFLDDLQWLDAATLDFLEDLLIQPDVQYLMLIGVYRDNEVDSTHPLWRRLEAIRQTEATVHDIVLAPLALEDLGQLIVDSLHCTSEHAVPLAQLVHEKTGGNPFFVIQFIYALVEERLLTFDHNDARWIWDLDRIHAKGHTDNIVELMAGKLNRLPVETRKALQELACLGNSAEIATISIVHGRVLQSQDGEGGTSEKQVQSDLWEAVRLELIARQDGTYKFVHDRIQEAAYSLIPERLRAEAHLRIGRLLTAHTPPHKHEEAIFEIVSQLNRGAGLITSRKEREEAAGLNLMAGKRAKTSTAYASALNYLIAGAGLLADDRWERSHGLAFALELNRAECEFLTSQLAEADQRLVELSNRAETTVERAAVTCLRTDVYTTLGETERAVAVCLDYLRHAGIDWTPHPTEEETRREYEHIWRTLGNRTIEALIDLPLMDDPASLATMDVLTKVLPPAAYTDANLACMTICRAVSLSLEHGNCDASCFAYSNFSRMTRPRFGDYEAGYRLGDLGYELVQRRGLKRFEASTYLCFGLFVLPWTKQVPDCRDLLQRAFEVANRNGDLMWASYTCCELNSCRLFAGDPLPELQREAESGFTFAEKACFGQCMDGTTTVLALSRTLRGLTPKFGCFDDDQLDELQFEHHLSSKPHLAIVACRHWVRKLQARYLAGDYAAALNAFSSARQLLWTSTSFFEEAEYHFYGALARAAASSTIPDSREDLLNALGEHHRKLALWAGHCPENFENRAALVGAEIARIEGRALDAMDLYERAIRSAHANGFIHNEALAAELASRFYAGRGFDLIAQGYLRKARAGYLRWGAVGKVRQLDELYPQLRAAELVPGLTSTIGAPIDRLDLTTVVKALQALSSEIVLEKLIDTLMRMVIGHAGAQRGVLILARDEGQRIEAEATTSGDVIVVSLQQAAVTEDAVPESIIRYVARTHESVILDDASAENPFSVDTYIRSQHVRSILCLPLINQAKLIGLLYLENNLTPQVFTPARIAVLKLLVSQAAISLENTRLYRRLEEREAKIRRLVDANIIGICIWNIQGEIVEANETFLQIVEYSREDLISRCVRWTDLTPAEWRDRDELALAEMKRTGTFQPFPKEYFRKDGSRIPVMIGGALFEGNGSEGVAFVLDLSQQKRAEDERKRAEEALQEAQAALAHVTRVTTLGELIASIAHEINQPLGAVVNNASACLRWLAAQNLEEARQSVTLAIANGHRAGEIIGRIRALAKKAPPQKDWLDLNETVSEVIAMAAGEVRRNRIALQTQLTGDLPLIQGDRIQLQQVILNLLINAIEAIAGVSGGQRELWISSEKITEIPGEPAEDQPADNALAETQFTHVLIAVQDSGPGVDPRDLDRLFEAFYTTKAQGLGMGLAISRSIIEAHRGRLWAKANVPKGAVFQFALPIGEERMS